MSTEPDPTGDEHQYEHPPRARLPKGMKGIQGENTPPPHDRPPAGGPGEEFFNGPREQVVSYVLKCVLSNLITYHSISRGITDLAQAGSPGQNYQRALAALLRTGLTEAEARDRLPEEAEWKRVFLNRSVDSLRRYADALAEVNAILAWVHRHVGWWWVADRPPESDRGCTSVREAVLVAGMRFHSLLAVAAGADPDVLCGFASRHAKIPPLVEAEAALTCEAAAVFGRRNPERPLFDPTDYFDWDDWAAGWARDRLPEGWAGMTNDQRRESLGISGRADASGKTGPPRPRWDSVLRQLTYGDAVIRVYVDGRPAVEQWEILDAFERAGWSEQIAVGKDNPETLGQIVSRLTNGLNPKLIRFRRLGGSGRVMWEPAEAPAGAIALVPRRRKKNLKEAG